MSENFYSANIGLDIAYIVFPGEKYNVTTWNDGTNICLLNIACNTETWLTDHGIYYGGGGEF